MAQQLADRRDIDFVLWEQFNTEEILKTDRFHEYTPKTCNMLIDEARKIAINEMLPTLAEGDREGLQFENGNVRHPDCFGSVHRLLVEGEWHNLDIPEEQGGQGAPIMISSAAYEYLRAANYTLESVACESVMASQMIFTYGTSEQIDRFAKRMVSGEWGGTMDLTEPQAGTDIGALETSARKNTDGSYVINGSKIFITNGEHNLSENIIHMVLARVEGAAPGTRGISILIVPKFMVNDNGTLGDRNDVMTTGIEHKHGLRTSPTCSLSFGSKGDCFGYLLGEENQGMKIMFQMMNDARMHTGFQGLTCASPAYLIALNYARERIQMREIGQPGSASPVAIINHPDVRRNLLWMKSYVEGMRSFFYYTNRCEILAETAETETERLQYHDLFQMLTPIIKSYMSDRSYEVCIQAMQVMGGMGYTKETLVEQYLRDCKITSIYEGANGVQALDLLGRKLGMNGGRTFLFLMDEIEKTLSDSKVISKVESLAIEMKELLEHLKKAVADTCQKAVSQDFKTAFAHSLPLLDAIGDTIMAWMLLWRASVAARKLESGSKKRDTSFYQGQIQTAEFFIQTIVPITRGRLNAILISSPVAIEITNDAFGGL